MMIKYFIIAVILFSTDIYSQIRFDVDGGYGHYLSNSENDTKTIGSKEFNSFIPFGLNITKENILGGNIAAGFSFNKQKLDEVHKIYVTAAVTPDIVDSILLNLSLKNYIIDLSYSRRLSRYLIFGLGPSFVITNRILESSNIQSAEITRTRKLYDKLASSGIGVNGYLELLYPLTDSNKYFFISSRLRARYTHSIWFDKGIRNLDDYSQEFFTAEFTLGVGYSF